MMVSLWDANSDSKETISSLRDLTWDVAIVTGFNLGCCYSYGILTGMLPLLRDSTWDVVIVTAKYGRGRLIGRARWSELNS